MLISSKEVLNQMYFTAHHPGSVDLVLSDELKEHIKNGAGPITLSIAAAEDLSENLDTNARYARKMAERT